MIHPGSRWQPEFTSSLWTVDNETAEAPAHTQCVQFLQRTLATGPFRSVMPDLPDMTQREGTGLTRDLIATSFKLHGVANSSRVRWQVQVDATGAYIHGADPETLIPGLVPGTIQGNVGEAAISLAGRAGFSLSQTAAEYRQLREEVSHIPPIARSILGFE
jgi:hypothetical protein